MAWGKEKQKYPYMEDVKENVLQRFPLLGVTVSKLDLKPTEGELSRIIDTAATDGKTVYFNPNFFNTLNEDQRAFVYAHEVMHVAFNHVMRSKGRNKRIWNDATDAVINQILKHEGYDIPNGAVDISEAFNHSAEEMYEKMLNEAQNKQNKGGNGEQQNEQQQNKGGNGEQQNEQQQNKGGNGEQQNEQQQNKGGNGEQQDELTDEQSSLQHGHSLWQQAVEKAEKEMEQQSSKSIFQRIKDILKPENNEEVSQDESKLPQELQEGDFINRNKRIRARNQQQIKQQIYEHKREVLKAMSQIESDMPTYRDIGESKQVANWKHILKQNMQEQEDKWSYRRSGVDNDYMARSEELEDEVKAKTEVMIDVSGSVDEELVKEFLRQLKPLLKRSDLMVGCFDDEFYAFKEIKNKKDIDNFRIPGGGGTDLDLAVRSFSDDDDTNKIVFTDGEGMMPRGDLRDVKNLFWIIYDSDCSWGHNQYSNRNWFQPVCGKVIHVDRRKISQNLVVRKNKYIGR